MIVPAQSSVIEYPSAVPLAAYVSLTHVINECAFWGVVPPDLDEDDNCARVWKKWQRDMVGNFLNIAQDMIEEYTAFPINQKWFSAERHEFITPLELIHKRVIDIGVKAEETIALSSVVNLATDPATIGPIATTVTDINEVRLYFEGTNVEISPSSVAIVAGQLSITVPRCRLVKPSLQDNDSDGLDYAALTNFVTAVDVKRVYTDSSTNAELIWRHDCNVLCSSKGCLDYRQNACVYVRYNDIATIEAWPASYADGVWTGSSAKYCYLPNWIEVYYSAGHVNPTYEMLNAVIRLANTLMPQDLCGCDAWQVMWKRDKATPKNPSRERLNCPFGLSDGAWAAWTSVLNFREYLGSTL